MFNFKNCITDIIKIYEQNATYKEKNISLTRSLVHYVKINDKFELKTVKEIKNIGNNISENDNSNGSDDNDNNYLSNNVGIKLKIGNKSNGDNNLKYKNKSKRYRNKNNKLDNNGLDIYDNSLSNKVNSIFKKIYF